MKNISLFSEKDRNALFQEKKLPDVDAIEENLQNLVTGYKMTALAKNGLEILVRNGSYVYLETLSQTCSFKDCLRKFLKIH